MAADFYAFASGAWRKAKSLHYNQAGTWRTLKEVWRNTGGTWVKVFSAAGFVSPLTLSASKTSALPTASINIYPDGLISQTNEATMAYALYYSPQTTGIGADYQLKLTHTSGNAVPSGGVGTWQALSATRSFSLSTNGNEGTKQSLGTVEIRRTSDLLIVSSGTYSIEVTDFT